MSQAILNPKAAPKVTRVNAATENACLYRNLGNGRRVPTLWAETVTLTSGTTEVVVASGVSFNDFKACEAMVEVTPIFTTGSGLVAHTDHVGKVYIVKDCDQNVVTLKSTASAIDYDTEFDVYFFLGNSIGFTVDDSNQIWERLDSASLRGKKV